MAHGISMWLESAGTRPDMNFRSGLIWTAFLLVTAIAVIAPVSGHGENGTRHVGTRVLRFNQPFRTGNTAGMRSIWTEPTH